jgi:hypothetical protein
MKIKHTILLKPFFLQNREIKVIKLIVAPVQNYKNLIMGWPAFPGPFEIKPFDYGHFKILTIYQST